LGDMITQLKRAGPGLGEHLFDKEIKSSSKWTGLVREKLYGNTGVN
jgi:hypothetical protein